MKYFLAIFLIIAGICMIAICINHYGITPVWMTILALSMVISAIRISRFEKTGKGGMNAKLGTGGNPKE
jgi:1,4-dihydroxy-2-naphthoate octaprenyltransferase